MPGLECREVYKQIKKRAFCSLFYFTLGQSFDAFFSGLLHDSTAEAWQTGHSITADVLFTLVSMAFCFLVYLFKRKPQL